VEWQIKKIHYIVKPNAWLNSPELHNKFVDLKHSIQRDLRVSHQKYLNNIIVPPPDNDKHCKQKKFWSYIKSLRKDCVDIPPLSSGTHLVTDNQQKAEALNKQFQSVFTKEHDRSILDKGPSPYPTMPDINITTPGILKLLQNPQGKWLWLNKFKSLKRNSWANSSYPKINFTFFMDSGTVPGDWKNTYITPIYKKGDRSQPSNYWPISLTNIVS